MRSHLAQMFEKRIILIFYCLKYLGSRAYSIEHTDRLSHKVIDECSASFSSLLGIALDTALCIVTLPFAMC